jgi:hypothetical protein
VNDRRSQTVNRMHTVGAALRSASGEIEGDDQGVRDVLEYASDRVERVAQYFSDVSLEDLRQDLTGFARRRPGLAFGGALLLGIAAGRALRTFARAAADEGESEGPRAAREGGTRALGGGAP